MSENILRLVSKERLKGPARLQIDVIADFICPWSYLGKHRLDSALKSVLGPTNVTWYPFQLNPEMPEGGMEFEAYIAQKFGDPAALKPALDHLGLIGAAENAPINFDKIKRVPNTLKAHRLMRQAALSGNQTELAGGIYGAFFERGEDIGRRDVLESIASTHGFSSADIELALDDDTSLKAVTAEESQARKAGVRGVPNYLVNRRLFVVGAQDSASLLAAIDRAMFGSEGELQGPDTVH